MCFFNVDADEKKKILKRDVVVKRKRGVSSVSDKEEDIIPADEGKKRMKGKGPLKIQKDDSPEDVIPDDVMKHLLKNMLKNPSVKGFVKEEFEENELMSKNKGKKKEKELTPDEIRHQEYLSKLPILQARTAPTALHTAIHGLRKVNVVNVEKFLAEIGFSSFYKFDIDYIPSRLGRYVVQNFDEKSCCLMLENEKSIEATVSKVHDLLGIPVGGVSLLSLEPRPVGDEFEEVWKSQFLPKKFKKVRVNDIALKLTESKEVDFLFKINFLTLFTNTMGMCSGLAGEINLDVVRRVRESTDISGIDWCEYIFHCLKNSKAPTTAQNKYTGPYTLLVVSFILYQVLNCFHVSVTYLLQLSYTFLLFVFFSALVFRFYKLQEASCCSDTSCNKTVVVILNGTEAGHGAQRRIFWYVRAL